MTCRFLIIVVLLFTACAFAQGPDSLWSHSYGGAISDDAHSIEQLPDRGYILGGWSTSGPSGYWDYYLVRTDSAGNMLWNRWYYKTTADFLGRVHRTQDNGFILIGYAMVNGPNYRYGWVVKTDANGDTLWSRTYGSLTGVCELRDGQQTADGGYVFAGDIAVGSSRNLVIFRTDANGIMLWSRNFHYSNITWNFGQAVCQTADGGFAVTGQTNPGGSTFWDILTVKVSATGDSMWSRRTVGPSSETPSTIHPTADGGLIITGYTESPYVGNVNAFLIKLAANGDSVWTRSLPIQAMRQEYAQGASPTSDGGMIITGFTRPISGDMTPHATLLKTNADGEMVWTRIFGGASTDGYAVCQTHDFGYAIGGGCGPIGGNTQAWLQKMGTDHTLPVELTAFEATPAGNAIQLSFTLASESDNDHFEIYRSTAQDGEYSRLVSLPSQGNGSSEHRYAYLDQAVTAGQTYWYFLADVDINGTRTEHRDYLRSATAMEASALPTEYTLSAYPNPFNPSTTIAFTLKESGWTRLAVYDATGREIALLANQTYTAGQHHIRFEGKALPTGIYFVRLESGRFVQTQKLLLLK